MKNKYKSKTKSKNSHVNLNEFGRKRFTKGA